jgi:hypothetical protein
MCSRRYWPPCSDRRQERADRRREHIAELNKRDGVAAEILPCGHSYLERQAVDCFGDGAGYASERVGITAQVDRVADRRFPVVGRQRSRQR